LIVNAFIDRKVTELLINGIRLKKEGDQLVCPRCNRKHKTVNTNAN